MAYLNTDDKELAVSLVNVLNSVLGYKGVYKFDRGEWDGKTPTTMSRTQGRYCVKINNGQEEKIGLWELVTKNRVELSKKGFELFRRPSLLGDDEQSPTLASPARLFDEDARFLVENYSLLK